MKIEIRLGSVGGREVVEGRLSRWGCVGFAVWEASGCGLGLINPGRDVGQDRTWTRAAMWEAE